jgi:hypothetical protein
MNVQFSDGMRDCIQNQLARRFEGGNVDMMSRPAFGIANVIAALC